MALRGDGVLDAGGPPACNRQKSHVYRRPCVSIRHGDGSSRVTLPIAVAWTFFAGWAAWVDFHPESWAHWGLVATSLYLLFAGAVQQVIPERNKA